MKQIDSTAAALVVAQYAEDVDNYDETSCTIPDTQRVTLPVQLCQKAVQWFSCGASTSRAQATTLRGKIFNERIKRGQRCRIGSDI